MLKKQGIMSYMVNAMRTKTRQGGGKSTVTREQIRELEEYRRAQLEAFVERYKRARGLT